MCCLSLQNQILGVRNQGTPGIQGSPDKGPQKLELPFPFWVPKIFRVVSNAHGKRWVFTGLEEPNCITKDYQEHIERFIPVMRSYNEHEAANHLEMWIKGTLPKEPLLDVSAWLSSARSMVAALQLWGYIKIPLKKWADNWIYKSFITKRSWFSPLAAHSWTL